MIRVLVSVYNISGYLMASLEELRKDAEIVILQRDCRLTPHKGDEEWGKYRWLNRERYSSPDSVLDELGDWKPDIFICGGWDDFLTRALARYYHRRGVKTVLCCDTPWENRFKQWINCVVARFVFVKNFDYVWVAGPSQHGYMRRIGFRDGQIRNGYYAADTRKFSALYRSQRSSLPHIFIYVGRYIPVKNIERMQDAFLLALSERSKTDWKLRMIGDGELWETRRQHAKIEHLGYKKPQEIQESLQDVGCFVLPSVREPWGVVVHEFALMGLPMICSKKVEACKAFLHENENGFLFDPFDVNQIKEAFLKIMDMTDSELETMGEKSHELGMIWTNQDWAKCVLGMEK